MTRIHLFSLLLVAGITSCNQKQPTNAKQQNSVTIEQNDVSLSDLMPKINGQ